jgi:integrase
MQNILTQLELAKRLKAAQADIAAGVRTVVKISDGDNLYLVVRRAAAPSWQVNVRIDGVRKPFALGTYPSVTLKAARELAQRPREQARLGVDPVLARRLARADAAPDAARKTLADVYAEWLAAHAEAWSGDTRRIYEQAFDANVEKQLGKRLVATLTPEDIRAVLDPIAERGSLFMVTRVHRVLGYLLRHARLKRYMTANPLEFVERGEYGRHQKRNQPALVRPDDVQQLVRRLHDSALTHSTYGLRLLALTFVRPGVVRLATWDQIDLEAAVWEVPDGIDKMRRGHLVPLSSQAVALLRALHAFTGGRSDGLVIPGRFGAPMTKQTMNDTLRRLGFRGEHVSHGFRAMAQTLLEEGGWRKEIVERQMAHDEENETRAAYNRALYWDERVPLMQAWADYLDALRAAGPAPRPWAWFARWREQAAKPRPPSQASRSSARA